MKFTDATSFDDPQERSGDTFRGETIRVRVTPGKLLLIDPITCDVDALDRGD
jgi:hypothetical protein